tara:strand:+ start:360 stop:953 length:594 start_codon:yes stop_codon:yes gene_type:complete
VSQEYVSSGRPPATSHAAIEEAAFGLFHVHGFDRTTTDEIAAAVGISRRTLFRYFSSKNDIPWGQFDDNLDYLRETLERMPPGLPLWKAIQEAVVAFNSLDPFAIDQHVLRMRLILQTPSLQAHSALMYGRWRRVIAEYAAQRTDRRPDDHFPLLVGHTSLALAVSAYEVWLSDPSTSIEKLIGASMQNLRQFVNDD